MHTPKEPLDERKQSILKAVVHQHVETAEPVGSEALVVHYNFGVRSATIRSEMAEMSEMGYLRQPHTSAGRVPSDLGYRFFVDRLMDTPFLPKSEGARARQNLNSAAAEVEHVVSQTCRILTSLTHYTSVATRPATRGTAIRHVNLSRVDGRKLLLVVVLSDGRVEHRILDSGRSVSALEAERASNLLASHFINKEIDDVGQPNEPVTGIAKEALAVLRQVAESLSCSEAEVCVEGTNYILRQPEFKDVSRFEAVLELLEQRKALYQLLSRVILGPEVTVMIGTENPLPGLHETSFVGARYRIGDRFAGTIGVVGPTRMDYRRAVAAVEVMARNLSELLTLLSLN